MYTTSPNGKAVVSSGTWGGGPLEFQPLAEIKAFYPGNRFADYLLTNHEPDWDPVAFDETAYRTQIERSSSRLRLPGLTYPALAYDVLYSADWKPTRLSDLALPLAWDDPVHGELAALSANATDAGWLCLHVRPNFYEGAGHHHADAGMFYFSALGVNWFTESPHVKTYAGRLHNQVLIGGQSEERYNARAKYLGATLSDEAAFAAADLTYAYRYRWNTQTETWAGLNDWVSGAWGLEPDPDILAFFRGTQRYKNRIWWPIYNFTSWVPKLRQPNVPVEYVYPTAGLVRGPNLRRDRR